MAPRKKATSGVKARSKSKNRSDGVPADPVDVSKSNDGGISEYEKTEASATLSAVAVRRSERIRRNAGFESKESGGLLSFSDSEGDVLGDEKDEEMIVARQMDQDNGDDYVPAGNACSSLSDDADAEFPNSRPSKHKHSTKIDSVHSQSQLNEDAIALQQAISLSLELSPGSEHSERNKAASSGRRLKQKKRSVGKNLFQLDKGEIDALYYAIVDTGRGLSLRELQRVASAHDFTWKNSELQEMISVFDYDNDGMLSLGEFRNIAARCHIMEDGNREAIH